MLKILKNSISVPTSLDDTHASLGTAGLSAWTEVCGHSTFVLEKDIAHTFLQCSHCSANSTLTDIRTKKPKPLDSTNPGTLSHDFVPLVVAFDTLPPHYFLRSLDDNNKNVKNTFLRNKNFLFNLKTQQKSICCSHLCPSIWETVTTPPH